MADYTSGQINFTGLGSGTDFNSLIEGLVDVEKRRITQLENWKASWENKVTSFQELNTKMLSLKTTLEGIDTMNEFLTKSVTSSSTSVLTATADSDATSGTHIVEVNQLAQNKIMAGTVGFSASSDVVNSSGGDQTFDFSYKGTAYSVTVPDGTTLETMVNLINNDPDNPGVRAALISDGSNYYLQFRGMDLGVDATLTVDAGTTVGDFAPGNWQTTQTNQNSQIKVDGWPTGASSWISNSSNTITNAIEGLTLNLKGADPGTDIRLTTDTDTDAIKENVRSIVNQINEVRTQIIEMTKFDEKEKKASILTGNYGVSMISANLKSIVAGKGVGFEYWDEASGTGDKYTSLSQLGILTDANEGSSTKGMLLFDEAKFDEALADDPDGVAELFAASFLGGVRNTNDFSYISHIDNITEPGDYKVQYTVDGSGNITSAYINGHEATIDNTNHYITGKSNKVLIGDEMVEQHDEVGLVIRVDNLNAGTYPPGSPADSDYPKVYLKQGKTGEMVEELGRLTSSTDGPLSILEDNYDDIMTSIDNKIAFEEKRISNMERNMRLKYARLDALLGNYSQIQAQLNSGIAQLGKG